MPLSNTVIAENLRRLRAQSRLTQADIAKKARLSRVAYIRIESGKTVPRSSTLVSLAHTLGVGVDALVREVPRMQYVRFRSRRSRTATRDQILAEVASWLRGFNEVEALLKDQQRYRLHSLEVTGRGASAIGPSALAAKVREHLGIGPKEPVRDLCGLLESCGIKVRPVTLASESFFGLSVGQEDGGPAIVVNTWERISVERWIFTAAHELGHLLMHRSAYDVRQTSEDMSEEKSADQFASHFLMPERAFRAEWDDTYGLALVDRVLKVKRMFRVSYRTVLFRLVETERVNKDIWMRFQAHYKKRSGKTLLRADEPLALGAEEFRSAPEPRRAHEPDRLVDSDFADDRLHAIVRRAIEREHISLARGAEILGVRLGEMRETSRAWV